MRSRVESSDKTDRTPALAPRFWQFWRFVTGSELSASPSVTHGHLLSSRRPLRWLTPGCARRRAAMPGAEDGIAIRVLLSTAKGVYDYRLPSGGMDELSRFPGAGAAASGQDIRAAIPAARRPPRAGSCSRRRSERARTRSCRSGSDAPWRPGRPARSNRIDSVDAGAISAIRKRDVRISGVPRSEMHLILHRIRNRQ